MPAPTRKRKPARIDWTGVIKVSTIAAKKLTDSGSHEWKDIVSEIRGHGWSVSVMGVVAPGPAIVTAWQGHQRIVKKSPDLLIAARRVLAAVKDMQG